ncbi:MAG: ABC transporter permease, partial [Verrucomicrobia bacterium]
GAGALNPLRIHWWLIVFPGLALALTILSLNFLGDMLRDVWDPRSQDRTSSR